MSAVLALGRERKNFHYSFFLLHTAERKARKREREKGREEREREKEAMRKSM